MKNFRTPFHLKSKRNMLRFNARITNLCYLNKFEPSENMAIIISLNYSDYLTSVNLDFNRLMIICKQLNLNLHVGEPFYSLIKLTKNFEKQSTKFLLPFIQSHFYWENTINSSISWSTLIKWLK